MRRASTSIIPKTTTTSMTTMPTTSEPCLENASREELIAMVRALSGAAPAVISPTPPPEGPDFFHSSAAARGPRRPSNAFGQQSSVSRSMSPLAPRPGDTLDAEAPPVHLNTQKGPLVRVASSANIVMLHALDTDDDIADVSPETTTASEQAWTGLNSTANTSVGEMPLDASVVSTPQGSIATALRQRKTLMVPETVGPLSVYNQIGSGAVGDVYCALNVVTEDMRALKVVPRERVLYTPTGVPKEAAVQRALTEHSASIAQLYECIDDPASPNVFFVMELVGPNAVPLGAIDSATGALVPGSAAVTMAETSTVIEQLAEGLSIMRKHLVAHGDIKLDNFLVTRPPELAGKPQLKIIDFGAAHIATRRRALCANLEQIGGVHDTPTRHGRAVAAARQLMGEPEADPVETPCCFNPPEALQMSAPGLHGTDDTNDMSTMSFTSAAANIPDMTPPQRLPAIATDVSPGVQKLPPAEMDPPGEGGSDAESDYSDADAYASPFFQSLDKPEGQGRDDLDAPALDSSVNNDASPSAMMMQASLNNTLPSLFRRRTVAVTLRSPNHGPARNKATLKQITMQQRRSLGRKTAQAGATAFAAPEVTQGSMPSPASDMWSAGVVLFCLVFHRMPFAGDNRVELEAAIVTDAPDFPAVADMTAAQRQWYPLVSQMLNKDPFARPSPAELLAAATA